jgi:hypothetical protein
VSDAGRDGLNVAEVVPDVERGGDEGARALEVYRSDPRRKSQSWRSIGVPQTSGMPPDPGARIWETDPDAMNKMGIERLAQQAATLGARVAYDHLAFAIRCLRDVAWLVEPLLGKQGISAALGGPAGQGDGEIRETLAGLRDSGFEGYVSLEPHLGQTGRYGGLSGPWR